MTANYEILLFYSSIGVVFFRLLFFSRSNTLHEKSRIVSVYLK